MPTRKNASTAAGDKISKNIRLTTQFHTCFAKHRCLDKLDCVLSAFSGTVFWNCCRAFFELFIKVFQPDIIFFNFITRCSHEKAGKGDNLFLMFEVAEGGFLDIDVKIQSPNGQILHQVDRESSGKFSFAARDEGVHSFCFSNKMSTVTPKIVMFTIEKTGVLEKKAGEEDGDSHSKLEEMTQELSIAIDG